MSNLQGKVIVITGASSGIGQATAQALIQAGANVMLAARRVDRLDAIVKALGDKAASLVTDVTDRKQVLALADETLKQFGRIDGWVNNAGLMPLSFLAEGKVEEWDQMVDVNIKGVLNGIHAALPSMLEQGFGDVVNIASVAGHVVFPSGGVYCATKFAVRAISEGLRHELAGKIRVTIISPGAVATELTNTITSDTVIEHMKPVFDIAIDPKAIADAIVYALSQPRDVSVNEMVIRPTVQEL
ncbi:MAG TPA: oxidoreductase [Phycisphaerales bacterium]|nr:oxidoreductase [Phycisphaerales bacterium]|tara:strand:+ start:1124 stop:1852 length:729 start_codon:yes stop_codon:yes gene_type:complete